METFINTFSGGGTNSFDDGGTGGDYEYNFSAVGGTGSSDLNSSSVLQISPWGGLSEVGFTSLEQVFRNPRGDLSSGSGNTSSDDADANGSAPITGTNFMGGGNTSSDDADANGSAPITGTNFMGGGNTSSDKSEPLLVGTNTTGNLILDLNNPTTDGEPLVVGANNSVKITVIGGNSSSSGTEPVVVGTNNTIIGAENIPSNGSVPLIVATNSTVEFIAGDDTSSSGTTSLVLGTNKTIGSEERVTDSNAPNNDANYQWNLTSGTGGGYMAAGGDSLTGGGDSMTAGSDADFFRNLFGAGQAPNPDYTYDFGSQNSGGNFMPGGVDLSMSMGTSSSSSGDTFATNSSFGGGMTNSNNSGADLPIAGSNNTIL